MRPSQILIRIVVFCCIALGPSDDGTEILIGVALGAIIGLAAAGIRSLQETRQNVEND